MNWFNRAAAAFVVPMLSFGGQSTGAARTVWEGVYTKEQAARGEQTYMRACAYCHRDNLQGDDGPALVGSRFTFQWRDRTLRELFETVSNTMPDDAPGSLTPGQYIDVISYLLQKNDAPAGDAPLSADLDALAAIVFSEKPKQ